MNAADVIDAAADRIWMNGRAVGTPSVCPRKNGEECVMEAFASVLGLRIWHEAFGTEANEALARFVGTDAVDGWNDSFEVCPANDSYIIDTMRRTAKHLREIEQV